MAQVLERVVVWIAAVVCIGVVVVAGFAMLPQKWVPWHARQAASSGDDGPGATIDQAEQALAAGDTRQAGALAAQAVTDNPSDAQVDNRAGNVALRADDAAAAEHDYQLGETADPHYPWNFVGLGQLYARQSKLGQSDAQLRAALTIAPQTPFLHYDLAVVELQEGLAAAALADFKAELAHNPTYKPAAAGQDQALAQMGRPSRIIAVAAPPAAGNQPQRRRPAPSSPRKPVAKVRLALHDIAPPAPSPRPSAPAKVVAVATTPSPTAAPTATPKPSPTQTPRPVSKPAQPVKVLTQTQAPESRPTPLALPAASHLAPLTDLASDAHGYFQGVTSDLNFTRVLPDANADEPTASMQSRLADLTRAHGSPDDLLRLGAGALESGRLSIATAAFAAATDQAPRDWRGPYFAGLTAQARGDLAHARIAFMAAADRSARPEPYTSLAIVDMENGDTNAAFSDAKRAASLDPAYEPARFVAGMLALMEANAPAAKRHLAAAVALGGAPARTQSFLTALYRREGDTAQTGSSNG
ncbi:MAG: hypothetical protein M3T49_10205 [Candidatus Eremiobacteraeota bacterium]|nr:hypothetical protein [Candidatus Eremiobacteraeota bacterium]